MSDSPACERMVGRTHRFSFSLFRAPTSRSSHRTAGNTLYFSLQARRPSAGYFNEVHMEQYTPAFPIEVVCSPKAIPCLLNCGFHEVERHDSGGAVRLHKADGCEGDLDRIVALAQAGVTHAFSYLLLGSEAVAARQRRHYCQRVRAERTGERPADCREDGPRVAQEGESGEGEGLTDCSSLLSYRWKSGFRTSGIDRYEHHR